MRSSAASASAAASTPNASNTSPERTLPADTRTTPATTIAKTIEAANANNDCTATRRCGTPWTGSVERNASSVTSTTTPATNIARVSTLPPRSRRNNAYSAPNPNAAQAIPKPHRMTSEINSNVHAATAMPTSTDASRCVASAGYATSPAKHASESTPAATRTRLSRNAEMSSPPRSPAQADGRRPTTQPECPPTQTVRATHPV